MICKPGKQVSAAIRESGCSVPTPCGGHGNCGKCKIKVIEGNLPVMTMDRVHLTEEEIKAGARHACHATPKETVVIEIL